MSFWDDVGEGLTEFGRKVPLVGDFFDNPEAGNKDEAFRQAGLKLEAAQGEAGQRRQQILQQALAYFNPTSQLMGQMYGPPGGAKSQADWTEFFQNTGTGMGGRPAYRGASAAPAPGPGLPPAAPMPSSLPPIATANYGRNAPSHA